MTIPLVGSKDCHMYSELPYFINTTSRSTDFGIGLSPFHNGPCELYPGAPCKEAKNMENAWQYMHIAIFNYGVSKHFRQKIH